MKKILSITSIVLLSTAVVFAGGTKESPKSSKSSSGIAVMKGEGSNHFKVYYKGESKSNVKITIFDAKKKEIFSETIRKVDGFVRPYQLDAAGEYTIQIEDGSQIQTERLNYSESAQGKIVQVRKLRSEEGKYLLTASGNGEEALRVNIYDDLTQKLLYSELQTIKENFAKVYNVSKVKANVSFEVVHANGVTEKVNQ